MNKQMIDDYLRAIQCHYEHGYYDYAVELMKIVKRLEEDKND